MPWLLSGRALEYRIGGEKRRALANAVVEVGYDDAAGPDDIAYCNQFDQRASYDKGSNTGEFGPYRPVEPGTADDYDEGVPEFSGPGFRANLVDQFVKRKAQGCRCVELDNPDAYTVDQNISALDLAHDYGFEEVAGKNPNAIKGDPVRYVQHVTIGSLIFENDPNLTVAWAHALRVRAGKPDLPLRFVAFDDDEGGRQFAERIAAEARAGNYADVGVTYDAARDEYGGEIEHLLIPRAATPMPPVGPIVMQQTMLILRGIANDDHPRGQLDDASALEYARRRGYAGRVLDIAGSTAGAAADRPQVQEALVAVAGDPSITALYGFSGGGYNLVHILARLSGEQKARLKLVVVLGAPDAPRSSFEGPWELVYQLDPPAGHLAGPAALLAETSQPKKPTPMPVSKIWRGDGNRRVAKSLLALYDQINAFAPDRDQSSDGTIGNEEHAARASDHNPDSSGVVKAIDISHDPFHGVDTYAMADQLRISRDRRIRYLISNHRICGSEAYAASNGGTAWQWGHYSGSNPHDHHMHVSAAHDAALYDDVAPWLVHPTDTHGEPVPAGDVKLKKGDTGAAVSELQRLLGMTGDDVDGRFGSRTDDAVRAFQDANGLFVDGIVGRSTWAKLRAGGVLVPPASGRALPLPQDAINRIISLARNSPARFGWSNGTMPIGCANGLAVSYAIAYRDLKAGSSAAREMAIPLGSTSRDALAWYGVTATDPVSLLRADFQLLFGSAMRESGGNYSEGRDTTAENVQSDTAEAGLFQQSWNSHVASPELPKLLAQWSASPDDGLLSIFREDVSTKSTDNFGSGDGLTFQRLCKTKPLFAVYCAAIGQRVIRQHWGPINRHEAQMRPQVDVLLQQVQTIVDGIVRAPTPIEGEIIDPVKPQPPQTSSQLPPIDFLTIVTIVIRLLKELNMPGDQPFGNLLDAISNPILEKWLFRGEAITFKEFRQLTHEEIALLTGQGRAPAAVQQPALPSPATIQPVADPAPSPSPSPAPIPAPVTPAPPAAPGTPSWLKNLSGGVAMLATSLGLSATGLIGAPIGPEATTTGMLLPLISAGAAAIGVPTWVVNIGGAFASFLRNRPKPT